MANTQTKPGDDAAIDLIDSVEDAETSALEAVRKFLDDVNGIFPDVGEDGPRRKIIDSAFKMTEQLVGASNQLAQRIVKVIENASSEATSRSTTGK